MKERRLILLFSVLITALFVPAVLGEELLVIKAEKVYLEDGSVLDNASVLVKGHKIEGVLTQGEIPEGAKVFSLKNGHLTPGLIDASSTAGVVNPSSWAEHSKEVIPNLKNLDAVDLDSKTFLRLAKRGVTAVYVTPDPSSVIGCQGTVLKTAGPQKMRILKDKWSVKANMGSEGWRRGVFNTTPRSRRGDHAVDFSARRPTTRMGMAFVFRKALFDAYQYKEGKIQGKDPALETLVKVINKEIPLRIQARQDIDIWSAIRMSKEFNLKFVLEEGLEAYRCIPELKAYNVPVIYGPILKNMDGYRRGNRPCLSAVKQLVDAKLFVALTAGGLTKEASLPFQAAVARRYGLAMEDTLRIVTKNPAILLGVQDRIGSIKAGMDADLVLWNGAPFSILCKPALVLIGGEVVYKDMK